MPDCVSGDICYELAVESSVFPGQRRFCQKHQAQLDGVRMSMNKTAFEKSPSNKEGATDRYCDTKGCPHRPVYGSLHCPTCSGGDE